MDMCRMVWDQEIKKTLFNIGDSKSTRLDEFSLSFFKVAWDIIGEDLRAATKESFLTSTTKTNQSYDDCAYP